MFEVTDCLFNLARGALVPIETSLQVKPVSLRIHRVVLRQFLLIGPRQLQLEPARNIARDLILQRHDIRGLAIIPIGPDHILGFGVDQFEIEDQLITALVDAASQHGLNIQFPSDCLRVRFFAFVPKHGCASFDVKTWELRKAANKRFGHSVRQIFNTRVAALVDKGHHGNRGDGRMVRSSKVEVRNGNDSDNDYCACDCDGPALLRLSQFAGRAWS